MNFSVSTRISGGFGILVALLVGIVVVSLFGLTNVRNKLEMVVEQTAPMIEASGGLKSSLLEVNDRVNRYTRLTSIEDLNNAKKRYLEVTSHYRQKAQSMRALSSRYPAIKARLDKSQMTIERYFQLIEVVFDAHRRALTLRSTIDAKKMEFEGIADQLDSLFYDLSEDSADHAAQIGAIGSLIREATISAIDALNIERVDTLDAIHNDLEVIAETVTSDMSKLMTSKTTHSVYFVDVQKALETFNELVASDSSLLMIYKEYLKAVSETSTTLAEAETLLIAEFAEMDTIINDSKLLVSSINEQAEQQVSSSETTIVILTALAIVGAALFTYGAIKSIRKPLKDTVGLLSAIGEGDLTDRIAPNSKDEFGDLSSTVGQLIERLRSVIGDMASGSQQLAESAEQTASIAREGNRSIQRQKEQTELMATAIEQMTATVNEVASSANNAMNEVQKAAAESKTGLQVVERNIATINSLAAEIERASKVINQLDEYSDNIGSILDVIRGIADKTNLLALNAAIEAARAGDQGRGFAVVADEVRMLAGKTQDSTSEIQAMIERLQTGTKEAVEVMERSQQEAKISVEQTASTGTALQSIALAVGVINDMSTHIATSAEQQSAVASEIHENVTTISTLAEQTATGANDSLAASQQFAALAERLRKTVNQFRT